MPDDVIVVGAGPAGAIAAIVLAQSRRRVRVLDRAVFPRDKMCGDSLNPGALRLLATPRAGGSGRRRAGCRLRACCSPDPVAPLSRAGIPAACSAAASCGATSIGCCSRPRSRRRSSRAGRPRDRARRGTARARFTASWRPDRGPATSSGERQSSSPRTDVIRVSQFQLGLARHPAQPRRWAIGAYFEGVGGLTTLGEMHVRRGAYIGVAPVPGGLANACLVLPEAAARTVMRSPEAALETGCAATRSCPASTCHGAPRDEAACSVRSPSDAGSRPAGPAAGGRRRRLHRSDDRRRDAHRHARRRARRGGRARGAQCASRRPIPGNSRRSAKRELGAEAASQSRAARVGGSAGGCVGACADRSEWRRRSCSG